MITSTKSIQNVVPKNAPEAISGSLKCKNFLGEHAPRTPRDYVLMCMENNLAPLNLILACCAPPPPPPLRNFLHESMDTIKCCTDNYQ